MQVGIVVFPGYTSLDIIGPYEVLARLPDAEVIFVAENPSLISNDMKSLEINVTASLDDLPDPDVVVVGGGPGQAQQMEDGELHDWLRQVDATSRWTTSVCTGSLILAAAGLLTGRRATSHWSALPQLAHFDVQPAQERVVIDGHYATAAGVSSGIDMALTLAGRLTDDLTAQTIQLIVEYAPEPPYQSGSLDSAPDDVVDSARRRLATRFPS